MPEFLYDPAGINSTAAAIWGVTILLISGVLDWDECLGNKSAWNTFTWFATVIAFATQLKNLGFVSYSEALVVINVKYLAMRTRDCGASSSHCNCILAAACSDQGDHCIPVLTGRD